MSENGQWHLQRSVSVGHIITTVCAVGAALVWGMQLNEQVRVNESNIAHIQQRLDRNDTRLAASLDRIETQLDRIEDRLEKQ